MAKGKNKGRKDKHRFPIARSVPPDKFQELGVIAEQAQTPDAKLEQFDALVEDGRLPYSKRKYPMRIGGVAAKWLRIVLNIPAPKTSKEREIDPLRGVLHGAVDDVLKRTRAAIKAGSPRPIMEELLEQTKAGVPLYASLIGQVKKFTTALAKEGSAEVAEDQDEKAGQCQKKNLRRRSSGSKQ